MDFQELMKAASENKSSKALKENENLLLKTKLSAPKKVEKKKIDLDAIKRAIERQNQPEKKHLVKAQAEKTISRPSRASCSTNAAKDTVKQQALSAGSVNGKQQKPLYETKEHEARHKAFMNSIKTTGDRKVIGTNATVNAIAHKLKTKSVVKPKHLLKPPTFQDLMAMAEEKAKNPLPPEEPVLKRPAEESSLSAKKVTPNSAVQAGSGPANMSSVKAIPKFTSANPDKRGTKRQSLLNNPVRMNGKSELEAGSPSAGISNGTKMKQANQAGRKESSSSLAAGSLNDSSTALCRKRPSVGVSQDKQRLLQPTPPPQKKAHTVNLNRGPSGPSTPSSAKPSTKPMTPVPIKSEPVKQTHPSVGKPSVTSSKKPASLSSGKPSNYSDRKPIASGKPAVPSDRKPIAGGKPSTPSDRKSIASANSKGKPSQSPASADDKSARAQKFKEWNADNGVSAWDRLMGAPAKKADVKPVKKKRYIDSEEEDDEDLDDFIDDGDDDIDISSHIKEIFGYDKSRYRDEDFDDRSMVAGFGEVMKEEARSARIGLKEDLADIRKEEEYKKLKMSKKKAKS